MVSGSGELALSCTWADTVDAGTAKITARLSQLLLPDVKKEPPGIDTWPPNVAQFAAVK